MNRESDGIDTRQPFEIFSILLLIFFSTYNLGGRRDDRRGGFNDRRGGGGGGRGGNPPGRKTEFRCVVENISAATSWQVRTQFLEILAFDLTTNFSCLSTFFGGHQIKFLTFFCMF